MSPTHSNDGLAFAYLDEGTGTPFVFQHGLGGDSSQPRSLWSGSGRLVCLECRGHGGTAPLGPADRLGFATFAQDLASLLDALGLDDVALGGVSMGAGVALRLAYEQPERIRALVLVRPAWFTAATADSMLAQFARPHAIERAAVLERLPADRPLPSTGPWPQLATPTLVIGTERDPVHPFACAEAWAQALPAATLRSATPKAIDEARHAKDVTTAIDDFLSSTRTVRAPAT